MTWMFNRPAAKPPTMTMPDAAPARLRGLAVRVTSKPMLDPGPAAAIPMTRIASIQTGGMPGHRVTTSQGTIASSDNETAMLVRCSTARLDRPLASRANGMPATTKRLMRPDATVWL